MCAYSQLKRGNELHTKQGKGSLGETEGQKERVTNNVIIISNNKDYHKNNSLVQLSNTAEITITLETEERRP